MAIDMDSQLTSITKSELEQISSNPYIAPAAIKFYREFEAGQINRAELIQKIERLKELV